MSIPPPKPLDAALLDGVTGGTGSSGGRQTDPGYGDEWHRDSVFGVPDSNPNEPPSDRLAPGDREDPDLAVPLNPPFPGLPPGGIPDRNDIPQRPLDPLPDPVLPPDPDRIV